MWQETTGHKVALWVMDDWSVFVCIKKTCCMLHLCFTKSITSLCLALCDVMQIFYLYFGAFLLHYVILSPYRYCQINMSICLSISPWIRWMMVKYLQGRAYCMKGRSTMERLKKWNECGEKWKTQAENYSDWKFNSDSLLDLRLSLYMLVVLMCSRTESTSIL